MSPKQQPDTFLLKEDKAIQTRYERLIWWVENQGKIRMGLIGIACAVILVLGGFIAWGYLDAFILGGVKEEQALTSLSRLQQSVSRDTQGTLARPVIISKSAVFSVGENRYDLYAELSNPNTEWWAEVSGVFSVGGQEIPATAFVLPDETKKPIVVFGHESMVPLRDVSVKIKKTVWHRVDHKQTGTTMDWLADHMRFDVENSSYDPAFALEQKTVGRAQFDLTNNSPYSYYKPNFYVVIKRGDSTVGIGKVNVGDLEPGETTRGVFTWFGTPPSSGQAIIIPDINLFSKEAYNALK